MASSGYFEVSGMASDQKPVIGWRMNFFIPGDLQDSGFRIRSGITHTGQPNIIIACFSCPPAKDLMTFQPRLSDFSLGWRLLDPMECLLREPGRNQDFA